MSAQRARSVILSALLPMLLFLVTPARTYAQEEIRWVNGLEQAINQAFIHNKHVLVYVRSDYCGFCKQLEDRVLRQTEVVTAMNEHFVPVRFDAMNEEKIWFMGTQWEYRKTERVHELAYLLLDGDMRLPGWVVINKLGEVIAPIHGYMDAGTLQKVLLYYGSHAYIVTSWEEFQAKAAF